jgi:hypothetical protein
MKTDQIKDFIENNNLDFSGSGSELNSVCTIISGYALHIGIDNVDTLIDIVNSHFPYGTFVEQKELERVFKFAKGANYGKWWLSPDAKKMYKF